MGLTFELWQFTFLYHWEGRQQCAGCLYGRSLYPSLPRRCRTRRHRLSCSICGAAPFPWARRELWVTSGDRGRDGWNPSYGAFCASWKTTHNYYHWNRHRAEIRKLLFISYKFVKRFLATTLYYCAYHVPVQPNFGRYYFYFLPDLAQTHIDHWKVLDKL